ncbi:hypothetical protein LINGRAHAP2_LOCUS5026 [Linum grandiflorum]
MIMLHYATGASRNSLQSRTCLGDGFQKLYPPIRLYLRRF